MATKRPPGRNSTKGPPKLNGQYMCLFCYMRYCVLLIPRTYYVRGAKSKAMFVCPRAFLNPSGFSTAQSRIVMLRCSHNSCQKRPSSNTDNIILPRYCKHNSETGRVDDVGRRCSHIACLRRASWNVKGGQGATDCKAHTENSMVDIAKRRCSHDTCTRRLMFNIVGTQKTV